MFSQVVEKGIELGLLEERHAGELFRLVDLNRSHLSQWLPWLEQHQGIEDALVFIRTALEQFSENNGFHAGIWVEGRLAGAIGVHRIDWANRLTSVGYWLDESLSGRGIMTKCCKAVLGSLFQEFELNRVEIRCATGNTKSCAIPERLGFTREGVIREGQWVEGRPLDLVVYSMLRREWKER